MFEVDTFPDTDLTSLHEDLVCHSCWPELALNSRQGSHTNEEQAKAPIRYRPRLIRSIETGIGEGWTCEAMMVTNRKGSTRGGGRASSNSERHHAVAKQATNTTHWAFMPRNSNLIDPTFTSNLELVCLSVLLFHVLHTAFSQHFKGSVSAG